MIQSFLASIATDWILLHTRLLVNQEASSRVSNKKLLFVMEVLMADWSVSSVNWNI